jgi:GT2 family glycosyltransferase
MDVPVILLNWNGWDDTLSCLRSLRRDKTVSTVWLVDNSSTLDRSKECLKILPKLRMLKLENNYGWAGGYNRALRCAAKNGYRMAFLLNNDTKVRAGFLTAAHNEMENDDGLAAVGSIILYANSHWVKYDGNYYNRGRKRYIPTQNSHPHLIGQVNGAGMLLRLDALKTGGWFDERFFCYWEETAWCWRMAALGWRMKIVPASVIYHTGEASDINANAQYYRCRNQFLLLTEHPDKVRWRNKEELAKAIIENASVVDKMTSEALLAALKDGLAGRFGRRRAK